MIRRIYQKIIDWPPIAQRMHSFSFRVLFHIMLGGACFGLAVLLVLAIFILRVLVGLPSYTHLLDYQPRVMSRVHASDGELIAEFAEERRIFVPIETIPPLLVQAFLSSEDKNFYRHSGIDVIGIVRATLANIGNVLNGRRLEGASTITQQVAKNFLLSSDISLERKLKEAILAMRLERAFSKRGLLELYLSEIYLGLASYGVAEAALRYFGKSLDELTIAEMAYLAALPKAPGNYHPFRRTERAIARRNWVIDRMLNNKYISYEQAVEARAQPLGVIERNSGVRLTAANHFVEEVRRKAYARYGQEELYGGGLSIRTTLDARQQVIAMQALRAGLHAYDRRHGYRGALAQLETLDDWRNALREFDPPHDVAGWDVAVVLEVSDEAAVIGLRPRRLLNGQIEPIARYGRIVLADLQWARAAPNPEKNNYKILGPRVETVTQVLSVGDIIHVETALEQDVLQTREARAHQHFSNLMLASDPNAESELALDSVPGTFQPTPQEYFALGQEFPYRLQQLPEIEGALIALDPHTGRVKAMVGGYSFRSSEFNRAVQAKRQPGSAFKPFVYAAALDNGYTPVSIVLDAPFVMEQSDGKELWKPENYSRNFFGPSTLRLGIEKSRNLMTVRMAQQLGIGKVLAYTRRFDIMDNYRHNLSLALGAGETTLMRLTRAYSVLVNGGRDIQPVLIDRVQDRFGRTIYRSDERDCSECNSDIWYNQRAPELDDTRAQILSPQTAYQIVSMLEGVVQRGTARKQVQLSVPLAGKTGTTNESRDAWFVGFAPDLAVGVFVGFDDNRPLGIGESGGGVAAPIFAEFMRGVMAGVAGTPFRIPDGIRLVRINAATGRPAQAGDELVILEAFKANQSVSDADAPQEADIVETSPFDPDETQGVGTGGLY